VLFKLFIQTLKKSVAIELAGRVNIRLHYDVIRMKYDTMFNGIKLTTQPPCHGLWSQELKINHKSVWTKPSYITKHNHHTSLRINKYNTN